MIGWSDKIVPLLREICLANESEGGTTIVILAEQDKEEMVRQSQHFVGETCPHATRVNRRRSLRMLVLLAMAAQSYAGLGQDSMLLR